MSTLTVGATVLVAAPGGYLVMRERVGCRFLAADRLPRVSGSEVLAVEGLPWSGMALDPRDAAHVCSAVLAGRNRVLELGSGVSTILLGLACALAGRSSRVISIEQDASWARSVASLARRHRLDGLVELRHAPLTEYRSTAPLPVTRWYESAALDDLTDAPGSVDLLLVDGPSAFRPEWQFDRWPAVEWADQLIAEGGVLALDDARRAGESQVAASWQQRLGPGWVRTDIGRTAWLERVTAT